MSPPAAAASSLSAELPLSTPTSGPAPEIQDLPILTAVADHFAAVYFDQRIGGLAALDIGTDGAVQSAPGVPLGIAGSSFDVAFNGSRFLVVYSGFGNHYAELFDTAFSPIGDPVVVGSYNPGVGSPEPVVAAAGSEFMVAWSAYDGTSFNVLAVA